MSWNMFVLLWFYHFFTVRISFLQCLVWCVRRNKMCTSYDQNCNFVPEIRFDCLLFAIHFFRYGCFSIIVALLQCSVQKVFIMGTQQDWNGHKYSIDDAHLSAMKSLNLVWEFRNIENIKCNIASENERKKLC